MAKISVLNLRGEIIGEAETATEAREMCNPVPEVAGARFHRMEKIQLADDDSKNPGLLCFRPRYGMV